MTAHDEIAKHREECKRENEKIFVTWPWVVGFIITIALAVIGGNVYSGVINGEAKSLAEKAVESNARQDTDIQELKSVMQSITEMKSDIKYIREAVR